MAPRKVVDIQNTKLIWVPVTGTSPGILDPKAPKLTELALGIDVTCSMSTTYSAGFEGSNTVNERSVCEGSEVMAPTTKKYQGNLVMYRSFTADGLPDVDDPTTLFKGEYEQGFLVRRIGPFWDDPLAVGDVVDLYKYTADVPQISGGTDSGFLKATIPMLQLGVAEPIAVVVA